MVVSAGRLRGARAASSRAPAAPARCGHPRRHRYGAILCAEIVRFKN